MWYQSCAKNCPAFNKNCEKCGIHGHTSRMCRTKRQNYKNIKAKNSNKKVDNLVEYDQRSTSDADDAELYLDTIKIDAIDKSNDVWTEKIMFNNNMSIDFKLDSGAQCNVLPIKLASKINAKIDESKTKTLISYGGDKIQVIGESEIKCQIKDTPVEINFKIINQEATPILGLKTCEKYHLLVRPTVNAIDIIDDDVFNGLGCLKNFEYNIDLVKNPKFEIIPARKIPFILRNDVKKELDKMVEMDVIEVIKEPTPVVSPMIIVKQKGKIRICIDPSNLNKNILRRHYPLKGIEEITTRIKDSNYFTLLDCMKGFWQIRVTDRTKNF